MHATIRSNIQVAVSIAVAVVTLVTSAPAQFRLPGEDRVRSGLRNLDKERLRIMGTGDVAGRDYTKLYLVNRTNEKLSVTLTYKSRRPNGSSEFGVDDPTNGWRDITYSLAPGQRVHAADTRNRYSFVNADSTKRTWSFRYDFGPEIVESSQCEIDYEFSKPRPSQQSKTRSNSRNTAPQSKQSKGTSPSSNFNRTGNRGLPAPPPTKLAHFNPNNGRTYYYEVKPGGGLVVARPGLIIHTATYIGSNQGYFRYRVTYTSPNSPQWALNATRRGVYEVWLPLQLPGRITYTANQGASFFSEVDVPPSGFASAIP